MPIFSSPKTYLYALLLSVCTVGQLSYAAPRSYDNQTWIELASQTCISQAPQYPAVAALNLTRKQLRFSCRCVASDMIDILPNSERVRLIEQMQARRNMQQVGENMMRNPKVKSAIMSCSASSYIWS